MLTGVPPAPQGVPQIDVTFNIDVSGIFNISAVERSTGNKKNITITHDKGRLSKEEIDRLVSEAEKYRRDDDMENQTIAARNALESLCRKVIRDIESKSIPRSEKNRILDLCNDLIVWLEYNTNLPKQAIEDKHKVLERMWDSVMGRR